MYEGTNAVLKLDGKNYQLSHYKITEDKENYFCYNVEMVLANGTSRPKLIEDSYTARLEVNGDAVWFFPWLWVEDGKGQNIKGALNGPIFCPFGLSEEEEAKYESLNLIVVSDVCYSMTAEVWKDLLLIFADWLKSKSIPQYQEFLDLADEVDLSVDEEIDEDESLDEEE